MYSEAVWSLYQRELNSFYGYDDNTSLEIVTRLTYIAAGNIQTWYNGYTQSPSGIWGGCGANSGYLSYLAADDDNGDINDGTPHMSAIFKVCIKHVSPSSSAHILIHISPIFDRHRHSMTKKLLVIPQQFKIQDVLEPPLMHLS